MGSSDKYWANAYLDKIFFGSDVTAEFLSGTFTPSLNTTPETLKITGQVMIDAGNVTSFSEGDEGVGIYADASNNTNWFVVYDTSTPTNGSPVFRLKRDTSGSRAHAFIGENNGGSRFYLGTTSQFLLGGNVTHWKISTGFSSDTDSTDGLGSSSIFWDQTFTDELILTNVGAANAAADKLVLSAIDLSAGNTILDINTEGTEVVGSGTPTADRTVAIRVNGEVIYLTGSTVAT